MKKASQRRETGVKKAAQRRRFFQPPATSENPQLIPKEEVMPDIKGTTRAQTLFLRAFRKSATGPAPQDWPSVTVLRRWLRKPAFKTALDSLRETLRFQADFQLALGASQAVQELRSPASATFTPDEMKKRLDLLRHAHLRQRFPTEPRLAS